MRYSKVAGTGSYLPEKILTNQDLERMVDTSDEWIRTRTGITQRHIAADDEMASDLAVNASREAMAAAGVKAGDIDLIIVATTTPDVIFPSTACILQDKLGISDCPAFDVQAVCSGFIYALAIADMFIRAGKCNAAVPVAVQGGQFIHGLGSAMKLPPSRDCGRTRRPAVRPGTSSRRCCCLSFCASADVMRFRPAGLFETDFTGRQVRRSACTPAAQLRRPRTRRD